MPTAFAIPGYQMLAKVAQGGTSAILKAIRTGTKEIVALKVLLPEAARNPELLKGFKRECRILLSIRHKRIVEARREVEASPLPALEMEFCEGESLKKLVLREPPIPLETRLRVAAQVAKALNFLHYRGIVHLDVKPDNVLVDPAADAKLIDFSSAETLAEMRIARFKDLRQVPRGTLTYIAPEQILGRKLDARTDIYSFGITLYELVAGRPPFESLHGEDLIRAHVSKTPPPLGEVAPGTPAPLERAVAKMLAKQPEQRFANLADVAALLQELASSATPAPDEPSWP